MTKLARGKGRIRALTLCFVHTDNAYCPSIKSLQRRALFAPSVCE